MNPTPRSRDVVLEQIRIVGLGLLPVAVVIAAVIGVMTSIVAADIVRGKAGTWFDSSEWAPVAFISFLLPFAVWRRDNRFGPAFLWTLPVDRRRLALAKVFAGWVWLMGALAMLMSWQRTLAALSGVANPETLPPIALPAVTGTYLIGSALVLGLRYPLRWLLGTAGLIFLTAFLREAGLDELLVATGVVSALEDRTTIGRAVSGLSKEPILTLLLLGTGLLLLWAAVSRHAERRRH